MIALDTNVLVRLLTRDDEKQAAKAQALFEQHSSEDGAFFVSDVVLAELAWTLGGAYGFDRQAIAIAFKALSDNATVGFESREALRASLSLFENAKVGFADCLIAVKAQSAGCDSLATFDKAMRSLPGVDLL